MSRNGRVLQDATECSLCSGTAIFMRDELCPANHRHDEGKGLNRVIVAACCPRTLEPLFRDTLREAGINQYYFEMANIREHNAWVHAKEQEEATQKAKDIIRMSVARACRLEPLQEFDLPVNKAALVVGGGIAGMNCALSIANQGHEVYLVEKDYGARRNGTKNSFHTGWTGCPGVPARSHRKVYQHPQYMSIMTRQSRRPRVMSGVS